MKVTESELFDLGDISAPVGSRPWCVGVREEARMVLIDSKSTREHARRWVSALKDDGHFRKLADKAGNYFLTWEGFCETPPPYGFGMSPDEVEILIESKPRAQQMAGDPGVTPLTTHGGDRKAESTLPRNVAQLGNSAEYIVRRLKRDAPHIAEALARGEYPSARAAGIAAGIIRVPTPLEVAQRAWCKLSRNEQQQFLDWLEEEGR